MTTTATPPTQQYGSDIRLTLLGDPISKARAQTVRLRNGTSHSYTPSATTNAEDAWRARFLNSGLLPLPPNRALAATVDFYLHRPPSIPKKRARPMTGPDFDNLTKLVTDALQHLAYDNDSRFVDFHIREWYATYPDPPRTELHIWLDD